MVKESLAPKDWFKKAQVDLKSAKLLLSHRILGPAGFHIQQVIEKYLKGYLLSKGWHLKKTHDLVELLNETVNHEPSLESFRELCINATEFYIEDCYPFLILSRLNKDEIERVLEKTKEMVRKIKSLYKKRRKRK